MSKIATRFNVTECKTAEELLAKCGLNWEPQVRKAGFLLTTDDAANVIDADKFRAIVNPNSGKALAFVSPRFKPNSHAKVVNDVWALVDHGSIAPHAVSVWDGGGKIALQFRCHDLDVHVGPKSLVSPLLTMVVNHDSGGADRSFFCDFDFWCRNQAGQVAQVQGEGVRHASNIITRYEDLLEKRILSMRTDLGDRYAAMRRMAESSFQLRGKPLASYFATALNLGTDAVEDYFTARKPAGEVEVLSADGKVLKAISAAWREDDHGVPGTVWHAYSAVTRYTTHNEGRNEATRMQRSMLGSQDRFVRAFNTAAALVSP